MTGLEAHPEMTVRFARYSDADEIHELFMTRYPEDWCSTPGQLRWMMRGFPKGQILAVADRKIIGFGASVRVGGGRALSKHNWNQITGGGYGFTSSASGTVMYGTEIVSRPGYARYDPAAAIVSKARRVCEELGLCGMVAGSRLVRFSHYFDRGKVEGPEDYVDEALAGRVRDPLLRYYKKIGWEVRDVLPNYLPLDGPSGGHAVRMIWRRPNADWPELEREENPF
jgi:hypothetical protein